MSSNLGCNMCMCVSVHTTPGLMVKVRVLVGETENGRRLGASLIPGVTVQPNQLHISLPCGLVGTVAKEHCIDQGCQMIDDFLIITVQFYGRDARIIAGVVDDHVVDVVTESNGVVGSPHEITAPHDSADFMCSLPHGHLPHYYGPQWGARMSAPKMVAPNMISRSRTFALLRMIIFIISAGHGIWLFFSNSGMSIPSRSNRPPH